MNKREHFDGIVGYDSIVSELKQVCTWLKDDELRNNPDFYLPRGILFYGGPGNGKTMMAREIISALGAPVVTIEGSTGNVSEEIRQAFEKLRAEKFAVLFIDEIDLLIEKSETAVRILQSEMDGFVLRDNSFFAIATTNYIRSVPPALRRSGRFDRIIELDRPKRNQLVALYRYYAEQSGLKGIDYRFLSQISAGITCADTRSIVNDAALRKGKGAKTEDVEDSYNRIINQVYQPTTFKKNDWFYRVAVHEVGHVVMLKKHAEFFQFYRANFDGNGGICHVYKTNEEEGSYAFILADTEISLGGYYAEKLLFGESSPGVATDLERARSNIASLVNKHGYITPMITLPDNTGRTRTETQMRRYKNEKVQKRLYKKIARKVERYIKQNKALITKLAAVMLEKGYIKNEDLERTYTDKVNVTNLVTSLRSNQAPSKREQSNQFATTLKKGDKDD